MDDDLVEVDKLILQTADYKNDYANVAAEKLLRKCSTTRKPPGTYESAYSRGVVSAKRF